MKCLDENNALAFLKGRLSAAKTEEITAHLASCETCRELVELAAPAVMTLAQGNGGAAAAPPASPSLPAGALDRGATVGRYVILAPVGRGAMGEVYAAFDPELNRKVALKLLRSNRDGVQGRTRLLREAQAIAKLQHPNVVVVFDVGTFGASVFIAMEFVEGRTLGAWLSAAPRSRGEILGVFLAAGRGLAAAHAAGLVHRDFKPDNVMVTDDGQVRVMDFGLARQASETSEGAPSAEPLDPAAAALASTTGSGAGEYLSVKLTQTGAMVGTPAYMAPEQFALAPTDARTDQFSFCVTLHEALYGQRPFDGKTILVLMANVTRGAVTAPPAAGRVSVPGWMRKVVLRGLAPNPDDRFPTMSAILDALENDPTVRGKRIGLVAATLASVLAIALAVRHGGGNADAVCRKGADRWHEVWEPGGVPSAGKEAIHHAFAATGRSYAELAFSGAARALDAYVASWLSMYRETCEATHVRGEQSADVLDLRMSCLQERFSAASALATVFRDADGTVVENAAAAATALPQLDRCANVALLKTVVRPPEDEAARRQVEALQVERAHLVALRDAGHCVEAAAFAEKLLPRVRAADYLPLLAETDVAAGYLTEDCLDPALGVARFKEGFLAGIGSRHDEAAAAAALDLSGFLTDRLGQLAAGKEWLDLSRAMLRRFDGHPLLDAWLRNNEGIIFMAEGRGADAAGAYRDAALRKAKILGPDALDAISSTLNLGNALLLDHRYAEAIAEYDGVREHLTRVMGGEHPFVALTSSNEGDALVKAHRYVEAHASYDRALAIWRKAGAAPLFLAYALTGRGLALIGEGRPLEATAPLEEALKIRVEDLAGLEYVEETRLALARALWADPGARARARALAVEARDHLVAARTTPEKDRRGEVDDWLKTPTSRL